jgi:hypothetical protein
MEKVNENTITISEEKMYMINEIAYSQLMLLNMKHGNSHTLSRVFKDNYDYGKVLIDMFVESSKSESEE